MTPSTRSPERPGHPPGRAVLVTEVEPMTLAVAAAVFWPLFALAVFVVAGWYYKRRSR